jgi:sodium transport system permease protein
VTLSGVRQALVVFRKEIRDSARDRRALVAIAVSVLVGPAVIALMVNRVVDRQRRAEEVLIPVSGAEHAPVLVDWLRAQSGVEIAPGPGDPEAAVRDGDLDVVVVIDEDFADRFRRSRAAEVRVVADSSRSGARPQVERVLELLQRYSAEIGALRLVARGISPEAMTTLRVRELDVSTPQQRAAGILNFFGMFLLLSALTGSMQLATDTTAGERERGSLEPLLVNPVPRGALVAGKWLAASVAGLVAVVLTMGLCVLLLKWFLAPDLGIRMSLGPAQLGAIVVAALSLSPLSAALQTWIGTYSRSFKEAQSYVGVMMTLPVTAIGIVGALYPLEGQLWMYAVPLLSHYMLATRVLAGEALGPAAFVLTTTVSLAVTAIMLAFTTRLFRSERIIFGR